MLSIRLFNAQQTSNYTIQAEFLLMQKSNENTTFMIHFNYRIQVVKKCWKRPKTGRLANFSRLILIYFAVSVGSLCPPIPAMHTKTVYSSQKSTHIQYLYIWKWSENLLCKFFFYFTRDSKIMLMKNKTKLCVRLQKPGLLTENSRQYTIHRSRADKNVIH